MKSCSFQLGLRLSTALKFTYDLKLSDTRTATIGSIKLLALPLSGICTLQPTVLWRPKEAKPDSGLICGPKTETTNCKRSIEPAKAGSAPAQVCELELYQLLKSLATFHFPRFWSLLSGTLVRQVE